MEGRGLDFRDVIVSFDKQRNAATSTQDQESLNEIAHAYCLSVYGAGGSRLQRILRKVAATLLFVAAVLAIVITALRPSNQFRLVTAVLSAATILIFPIVGSFWWQRRQLIRETGQGSREDIRDFQARRFTEALGGPQQFLAKVEAVYSHLPELSAQILAPYWNETAFFAVVSIIGIIVSSIVFMLGVVHKIWPPTVLGQLHQEPRRFIMLCLVLLDAVLAGYFAILTALSASRWRGIHVGKRYYPLQVFCRDLHVVGGRLPTKTPPRAKDSGKIAKGSEKA